MRSAARGRRRPLAASIVATALLLASSCGDENGVGSAEVEGEPVAVDPAGAGGDDAVDEGEDTGQEAGASDGSVEELFPDVIAATAERSSDGSWSFSATLSSPYDSPERYADAWRVLGPDGEVYGIRELAHDHASEQPFTRSRIGDSDSRRRDDGDGRGS